MTNQSKYKHKYRVPGNTLQWCVDLCKKNINDHSNILPCGQKRWLQVDYSKCLYPSKIGQPKMYVISETIDGKWVCSCPAFKFKRIQCNHIKKVQKNPEEYEIPIFVTQSILDIADKL